MRSFFVTCMLVGCGGGLYTGPVTVTQPPPLPLDRFHSQYVRVHDGARSPAGVRELRARCVDASVCTAQVMPAADKYTSRQELRVYGKRPGKTSLVLDYIHPGTKQAEQRSLEIEIIAPEQPPRLALGTAIPAASPVIDHEVKGKAVARCARLPEKRTAEHVFACESLVAVEPNDARARTCTGMCPGDDEQRYTLCAHDVGGAAQSLTIWQRDAPGELEVKLVEGERPPGVCEPRP